MGAPDRPPALPLGTSRHGVTFAVRVIPRAGRTGAAGTRGDALLVRLAAPPVEGAANDALVSLLADVLKIPSRNIRVASGQRGRNKHLAISGVTSERCHAVLS